jgi:primosomal protein N''
MNSVTAQAPFYPKELLEALSDQIQIAKTALSEAITDNPRESPDYVRRRRELHQNFETGASRLLDMIRDRLVHLTIVQETVPA